MGVASLTYNHSGELRIALLEFNEKYNRQWLLERHSYRTLAQVRADVDAVVAA